MIKLLEAPSGDAKKLKEAKELADKEPTDGLKKLELAKFYFDRAMARKKFGRVIDARDDFAKCISLFGNSVSKSDWTMDAFEQLFVLEFRLGRLKSAIDVLEKGSSMMPSWTGPYTMKLTLYAYLGDIVNAEKSRDKILHMSAGFRHRTFLYQRDISAARILDARGKHKQAESLYRDAHEINQYRENEYYRERTANKIKSNLAFNLICQKRFIEAEIIQREIAKNFVKQYGPNSLNVISRIGSMWRSLAGQGKYKQAEKLVRYILALLEKCGVPDNSFTITNFYWALGSILMQKGETEESFNAYSKVFDAIKYNPDYRNSFIMSDGLQTSYLQMGKTSEIHKYLNDGYSLALKNYGSHHLQTALLGGLLGVAYNQLGDRGKAYQYFSKSIPIIRSNPGRVDQTRKTILEGYLDLLHWIQENGQQDKYKVDPVNESFMAADMMRTKSTSYALNQSLARTKTTDPGLGKLVRDEQDLELQINAYWGSLAKLAAAPKGQEMPELASRLRGTISDLQAQRKGIRQELENRYPKYGALVKPPAQGLDAIRALLASGESLIAIYPGLHRTYLWAGAKGGKAKFIVVELGRKELDTMVSKLKSSLTRPNITTYRDIPAYDFETAHAIYAKLLKPLADVWQDNSKITLLADGSLGELPFEVLITKPYHAAADRKVLFGAYRKAPWLANQATITRLPAASSLQALRRSKAAKGARRMFAGFGNPVFSQSQAAAPPKKPTKTAGLDTRSAKVQIRGVRLTKQGAIETTNLSMHQIEQLSALPDTEDEIKSVARALMADPKQDLFLGKKASERVVKTTRLDNRKVLAFATHALLPGDLSGLDQSALALSSPRVTGEKEDGLLTMGEVMTLKLASDLVILSGCSTGAASSRGAEAISGLGRAFFYAGSKGVMVTMWPVETASAGKLVTSVFEYKKDSLSQSLNAAKLNMIQKGGVTDQSGNLVISYAHPIFWAPYVFVGDANSDAWR